MGDQQYVPDGRRLVTSWNINPFCIDCFLNRPNKTARPKPCTTVVAPAERRICISVIIGPPRSGKSAFAREVSRFFNEVYPDYFVDIIPKSDNMSIDELTYHLKCYLSHLFGPSSPPELEGKDKLIIIDTNMYNPSHRFEVYRVCYLFNVSYSQIYIHFNPNDILERTRDLLHEHIIQYDKLCHIMQVSRPRNWYEYWETNVIVIFNTYAWDRGFEMSRFYNFIRHCFPLASSYYTAVTNISPTINNEHEVQIQSGVLYRDKLLRGKPRKPKKPKK